MTPGRLHTVLVVATLLAAAPARAAEDVGVPSHNPFKRPAQAVLDAALQGGIGAAETSEPRLVMTAMLLAGPDTMVSINDTLLRIGDRVEGYRLVAVKAGRAVLVKDGKRRILDMETKE